MDETFVFTAFARRITRSPAVIFDKVSGKNILNKHVVKALENVRDKIKALTRCLSFLDKRENEIRSVYPWNSWEITQTNPQHAGTIAQIEYVRKQLMQIKSVIELEELERSLCN